MLGRSTAEFIFIRLVIAIFRYPFQTYLASLSLYLAINTQPVWNSLCAVPSLVIYIFITIEIVFYLLIFRPAERRLQNEARHPPPISREERKALFHKCHDNIPSPERYLSLWFLGKYTTDIARGDVRRFLAWAFFDLNVDSENASDDVEEELEEYIKSMEALLGWEFPHGNTNATCLRLTVDPVNSGYRSMVWYAIVFMIDLVTCISMWFRGYTHHTVQNRVKSTTKDVFPPRPHLLLSHRSTTSGIKLGYWLRPHTVGADTLPVVFLHGIGVGLWAYTTFVSSIPAGTGILAPEFLNISARITDPEPLTKSEFLATLSEMLQQQGWGDFIIVTHSYGSVLATHILRSSLADRVKGVTLIDPVSLCLHLPDVAFNFTRRCPRWANEWQLWYFATMDLGVAHTLGRHFFWNENIVWKEELVGSGRVGRKVTVCLAEKDLIVDTLSVARYLSGRQDLVLSENGDLKMMGLGGYNAKVDALGGLCSKNENVFTTPEGINVLWFPALDHAQVLDRVADRSRIIKEIKKQCEAVFW